MARKTRSLLTALLGVALALAIGLAPGMSLTAHAEEYTTLKEGDVLHLGDAINSETGYVFGGDFLDPKLRPWTLVRADITDPDTPYETIIISDTGAYYLLECAGGGFASPSYARIAATRNSDGIYVKSIDNYEIQKVTFAVHEPVNSMILDPSTAQTVTVGDKVSFEALVDPDDATDKKVKWSVGGTNSGAVKLYSDEACNIEVGTDATDTLKVYAKGISTGTATITCTATNGTDHEADDKSATCEVTVTDSETAGALKLSGSGHVQGTGDEGATEEEGGILVGTEGQSKRLESFSVSLPEDVEGSIEYRSHVQGSGWEPAWAKDGAMSGTTGESRRVEAVQMRLSGNVANDYSVWYRVHSQTYGWLRWAKDGQAAGTAGQSKRAEAVEVQVLPKGQTPTDHEEGWGSYVSAATGEAHVQGIGWASPATPLVFGTEGESRRLEAIRLSVPNQPVAGGISYEVHAQGVGWMPAAADGELAGTEGESRRLEAVRVRLTGDLAGERGYSVWYRVHSQTYGWLGWAHDGEEAGTTGLSRRAEAIEVQVLPQGQVPAGYDAAQAACVSG